MKPQKKTKVTGKGEDTEIISTLQSKGDIVNKSSKGDGINITKKKRKRTNDSKTTDDICRDATKHKKDSSNVKQKWVSGAPKDKAVGGHKSHDLASRGVDSDAQWSDDDDVTWSDGDDWRDEPTAGNTTGSRQLEKFKSYLGITQADIADAKRQKERQQTSDIRPGVLCPNAGRQGLKRAAPEVIVFQDPAKRKKSGTAAKPSKPKPKPPSDGAMDGQETSESEDDGNFDLERARYEIRRFAIKGMTGAEKEEGMTSLLVQMGAKTPKKKCVNYKELQVTKKGEKKAQEEKVALERAMGNKIVNPNRRKKYIKQRPTDRNDVGVLNGQMGQFKHGQQKLKSRDIEAVKKQGKRRR